jgi:cyanophycin synthetase
VFVREGWMILAQGSDEQPLVEIDELPMTQPGSADHDLENLLAAVAAAWALGLSLDLMRTGVATYIPENQTAGATA